MGGIRQFVAHAQRQKGSILHPLDQDRSHSVGWTRKKSRIGEFHLPIAHQSLKWVSAGFG